MKTMWNEQNRREISDRLAAVRADLRQFGA